MTAKKMTDSTDLKAYIDYQNECKEFNLIPNPASAFNYAWQAAIAQQNQDVNSALEAAAKIVSDFAEQCYDSNATMSDLEVVASEIRALIK